jgi:glycosyltransferase involved in cell wall biosynthesis
MLNKRINILFVIDGLYQGGKERQFMELLKGLDKSVFKIGIVTFHKNMFYTEQAKFQADYFKELDKSTNKFKPFFSIFSCFKKFRPDIVHTWDYLSSLYVYFPTKIYGAKFINGSIRDAGIEKGWQFKAKKRMLKQSDIVISNSQKGLENYGVSGKVIYNAVDFGRFSRKHINGEFRIIKVANFTDYKNHQMFLDAAVELLNERVVDRVFLAGSGKYEEKYKNFTALLPENIRTRIEFLGAVKNIEHYLEKCSIGVLCSTEQYSEGISNSVLEYMAAGIIAIATNIGATNEIISDGVNGFLVPPDDSKSLADKIRMIKDNTELQLRIKTNAIETIKTKFNYQNNIQKIDNLYKEILNIKK